MPDISPSDGRPDGESVAPEADLAALDPVEIDVVLIELEERAATRRLAAIEAGRRKGGLVGAAMAGAMLTIHEIYEGLPPDVEIVEVSESPDQVPDIDLDGIDVIVGDVAVWAPPPADPRADPPVE